MVNQWVANLLLPGRQLYDLGDGVLSALPGGARNSRYDWAAPGYDAVVGSALYNRLVWQTSSRSYATFADAALESGDGPLLDVGGGTAAFTAAGYRASARRLVLVDRSLGMLRRAARRLGNTDPERVCLVHADLFDLPFVPGSFATVTAHGILHLFDDAKRVVRILRSQVEPGGSVYATSLVAETPRAHRMLRLLHSAGEAAVPRNQQHVTRLAGGEFGDVEPQREGGMLFLRAVAVAADSPS